MTIVIPMWLIYILLACVTLPCAAWCLVAFYLGLVVLNALKQEVDRHG